MTKFMHNTCWAGLLFVSSAFLTGCYTAKPVVRLKAACDHNRWEMGREIISIEKDSVTLEVFYENYNADYYILNARIVNRSQRVIDVYPEMFYYQANSNEKPPQLTDYHAANPEDMLLKLDMDASQNEASQKNAAVAAIVGTTVLVAADIATSNNQPSPGAHVANDIATDVMIGGMVADASTKQDDLVSINDAHQYWTNEVLRRNTLFPNFETQGTVLFPRNNQLSTITFRFVIGNQVFEVPYNQVLYYPQSNTGNQ
jgi:hypothetical protein